MVARLWVGGQCPWVTQCTVGELLKFVGIGGVVPATVHAGGRMVSVCSSDGGLVGVQQ